MMRLELGMTRWVLHGGRHCLLRGIDNKAIPRRFHILLLLLRNVAVLVARLQHLLDQALPFGLLLDDLDVQGRYFGSGGLWLSVSN